MKKETKLEMYKLFDSKLEEITNLVNMYEDLSSHTYKEIKLKVDLSEIKTLKELDLFEMMITANNYTLCNLFFHGLISINKYHIADKVSDIFYVLIGGRRAELKLGL